MTEAIGAGHLVGSLRPMATTTATTAVTFGPGSTHYGITGLDGDERNEVKEKQQELCA